MATEKKKREPIDKCPVCGETELRAICDVPVEYWIVNTDDGEQDWSREEVLDDSSTPFEIKCAGCGTVWDDGEFELDSEGFLVNLSESDAD